MRSGVTSSLIAICDSRSRAAESVAACAMRSARTSTVDPAHPFYFHDAVGVADL